MVTQYSIVCYASGSLQCHVKKLIHLVYWLMSVCLMLLSKSDLQNCTCGDSPYDETKWLLRELYTVVRPFCLLGDGRDRDWNLEPGTWGVCYLVYKKSPPCDSLTQITQAFSQPIYNNGPRIFVNIEKKSELNFESPQNYRHTGKIWDV